MRAMILGLALVFSVASLAADSKTIDFNYSGADIAKVLGDYAKASGQKFIVDPTVQGKVTILNPGPVPLSEAFNQLSSALALNGLGISKAEDTMTVMHARMLQRNNIEVSQELPAIKPERMFTWVVNLKYTSAIEVNKQLRILTSKDGELVPYTHNNQIYVSDWTSNLHRIAKIIKEIDIPAVKGAKAEKPSDKKTVKQ